MKKDLGIIGGLFLLIAILIVFGQGYTTGSFFPESSRSAFSIGVRQKALQVDIKNFRINALLSDSPKLRRKGLSKSDTIPLGSGMLFVFDTPSNWGIWMKDMKFAIDIIWIDDAKKVIAIAKNVPPQPGKKDKELTIYKPNKNAKYVLEVNAGLSNLHNISEDDPVSFDLTKAK